MIKLLQNKTVPIRLIFFFCLLAAFVYINIPFTVPFALAGIFALGLDNFVDKMCRKTKYSRKSCIFLTLLAGFVLFWTPISIAVYRLIVHVTEPQTIETDKIIAQLKNLQDFIINNLKKISEWTGLDVASPANTMLRNLLKKTGEIFLKYSTEMLGELPAILLSSFVFVILLYLLLRESSRIRNFVMNYSFLQPDLTQSVIDISQGSCSITLFSTFVIGLIQASIIGFGSLFLGEGDFWLILTVTFFVSFIPVIGAAPVGYLLSILAFIGGRTGPGIGMAIIATVAGSIDNVLKPFMVGKENKISPLIGFTCVVGAIIMLGLPGLLIGPVIMNLFAGLSPLLLKSEQ